MRHRKHVKVVVTPISLAEDRSKQFDSFKKIVESSVYNPSENAVYQNFKKEMENAKRTT